MAETGVLVPGSTVVGVRTESYLLLTSYVPATQSPPEDLDGTLRRLSGDRTSTGVSAINVLFDSLRQTYRIVFYTRFCYNPSLTLLVMRINCLFIRLQVSLINQTGFSVLIHHRGLCRRQTNESQ